MNMNKENRSPIEFQLDSLKKFLTDQMQKPFIGFNLLHSSVLAKNDMRQFRRISRIATVLPLTMIKQGI